MRPPRFARALVRLFADPGDRSFLLDDLADRFGQIARTRGDRAARRWYWSQALSVVPWSLRDGDSMRRRSWSGLAGDLRFGLRALGRHPLYATGVVGTLGLGMAAALVTFVVAWTVWLAPMPYPEPDRIVRLYEVEPADGPAAAAETAVTSRWHRFSPTLLEDFHAHRFRTLEGVSWVSTGQLGWRRDGETRPISRLSVSPEGFGFLGITPFLGRLPAVTEREVLLSERFWRTTFGGDTAVLGTTLTLRGRAVLIAGVGRLPGGFPGHADVVEVMEWNESSEDRAFRYIDVIARLRPEQTVDAARAEASTFVAALAEAHPEHRGWTVDVVILADDLVRPFRGVLALLLAAGTTFLLLAAVNVTGLVAARRVASRRDRSIRLALGASEARLLRASLLDGLLLALLGAAAGVVSAAWMVGPVRALVPFDVPRLAGVAVTGRVALAGLAAGAVLGLVLGVAGYFASRGVQPAVGRAPVWRAVGVGGRRALVVCQVALTTLLTAAGAAILHRADTLRSLDLGFQPEGVSATTTVLPEDADRWETTRTVLAALDARGFMAAAAFNTPMNDEDLPQVGMRADDASEEILYHLHFVSPGYFAVMGVTMLAGRDFGPGDDASSRRVVIVSDVFVDRYFPPRTSDESVVGRALAPLIYETTGPVVVGVVASTRHAGPEAPVEPEIYSPLSQLALQQVTLLIRGEPEQLAGSVPAILAQVDPRTRWTPLTSYTARLDAWYAPLRLQLVALVALGVIGLVLVSLGLYSLMAYQVASRRRELGIRKAVGATDGRLVSDVIAGGVVMAAVGAIIGLAAWYTLLPRARTLVDGIDGAGAAVPLTVAAAVAAASVLATAIPAVRATRVDPSETLRTE